MQSKQLKVVMTGQGLVTNPDGTTQQIELRAERPLTDDERARYLAEAIERGIDDGHSVSSR